MRNEILRILWNTVIYASVNIFWFEEKEKKLEENSENLCGVLLSFSACTQSM